MAKAIFGNMSKQEADGPSQAEEAQEPNLKADFNRLFSASVVSLLGSQFASVAIPTLAILSLHASAAEVAGLLATQTITIPIVSLFAGVWLDRVSKGQIALLMDLLRFVTTGLLALLIFAHKITMIELFALTFATGVCSAIFSVAYSAMLPAVVPKSDLLSANTRMSLGRSLAETVSLTLSGFVIQAAGVAVAFCVDSLSYLASLLFISRIRTHRAWHHTNAGSGHSSLTVDMAEGFKSLMSDGGLRAIAGGSATLNFGGAIVAGLFFVFCYERLKLSAASVGVILGIGRAGLSVGALIAASIARRFGGARTIAVALSLAACSISMIPLSAYVLGPPLLVIYEFIFSVASMVFFVNATTYRQEIIPDNLRARVAATSMTITTGVTPIGALVGAALAARFGTLIAMQVGAAIAAAAALWFAVGRPRIVNSPEPC